MLLHNFLVVSDVGISLTPFWRFMYHLVNTFSYFVTVFLSRYAACNSYLHAQPACKISIIHRQGSCLILFLSHVPYLIDGKSPFFIIISTKKSSIFTTLNLYKKHTLSYVFLLPSILFSYLIYFLFKNSEHKCIPCFLYITI